MAVGDFNNDGTMDLAVASEVDPNYPGDVYIDDGLASVLLGNGDGSFHIQDVRRVDLGYDWPVYPPAADSVAVADFNGDGNQDFVVGSRGSGETGSVEHVSMLLGDGQGNIASVWYWQLDHGWSMAAGDLDGDGDADLVTATGSEVKVRLGNGTGGFVPGVQSYPAGLGASEVVLGDFNRDGKLDIATANYVGGNVSVLRGLGNGTFQEPELFASGSGASAVAAGDFNGDGWLDLATANVGGNTASVLINDQSWGSVPPSVSVSDATVTEGNAGTVNATFTLTLSKPSAQEVTIQYSTADFTATAGSDYVAATGTITIPAGQTSKTFTVAVKGDLVVEENEYFAVNLTAVTNAGIYDGQGDATILDDEPRVSISGAQVLEGNTGTTNATFTVTLSKVSSVDVTVQYQPNLYAGSATAGSDYVAASGTVTIPAGQISATVMVAVIGDRLFESTETFCVYLSGATNALISNGWGYGTIVDDEPRISISDVTKSEGRRNKTKLFTFTVTLSAAYDQAVTMSYRTVDGTTTTGDYVAKTGTLTFAPGEATKTITIEVKGDSKREANESFYLDLFGLSANAQFTKNRGLGTILNDD